MLHLLNGNSNLSKRNYMFGVRKPTESNLVVAINFMFIISEIFMEKNQG